MSTLAKLSRRQCLATLLVAAGSATGLSASKVFAVTQSTRRGPPVGPPWPKMTEGQVKSADGTPIYYRSGGTGTVNVVFVHGWSCSHQFFGPQFAPVCSAYQVMALDLAGHGFSGSRKHHTVRALANDVLAVAALSEGPIVLVVHSAGGRVACELAGLMGERLLGIVGIDSFQNLGLPAPSDAQIEASLGSLRSDFSAAVTRSLSQLLPANVDPALSDWIREQMTGTDAKQAIAASQAFAATDSAAAIAGFSKPVIALNSDGVPTHSDKIRILVPGFSTHILSGQGHFPHLVAPDSFNPLLLSTLDGLVERNTSSAAGNS